VILNIALLLLVIPVQAGAASTWNPTLLVNTEAFQTIDDVDTGANVVLKFGETLQESLTYNRGASQFEFTRSLKVAGNLTATGSLSIKNVMSGSALRVDTNADVWGNLAVSGTTVLDGNVGIGTTAPETALEVTGTISGAQLNVTGTGSFGDIVIPSRSLGTPTYSSVSDYMDSFGSAGRKTGGTISDAGSSTIAITGGTGFIKATDDDNAQLLFFDFPAPANISIPTNSTRYIGVEYNGGSPQVVARTTWSWNLDSEFPLGRVVNDSINGADELYISNSPWWVTDGTTNIIEAIRSFGLVRRDQSVGGLMLSITGTRNIAVSAGTVWSGLNEFDVSAFDTAVSDTVEYYWYKAGSGWQSSDVTQYSVTQWNDVTQTTLQTMGNNKYGNIWVYGELDNGVAEIALLYPQAQYNSAAEAEATNTPSNIPSHITEAGMLLGRIIIKQNVNTPVSVESAFGTTYNASVTTDHGNLSGLSDDDHTQYLLLSGRTGGQHINDTVEVTGTASGRILSFGTRLTGSGNVSIRTLTDSTTAFQVLDNDGGNPVFNIATVNERVGIGTATPETALEVTGTASGNFVFGQQGMGASGTVVIKKRSGTATGNTLVVDTNGLVYDATNKRVGIGTAAPAYRLDVSHNNSLTDNTQSAGYPLRIQNTGWAAGQFTGIEFWDGSTQKAVPTSRIISQMLVNGAMGENLLFQTQGQSATNPNPNAPTTGLTVTNNGNVMIGTATDRASRLTVKGRASFPIFSGTVSTTAGSATVTGLGTYFYYEVGYGDRITIGTETKTVTAIASHTSLTVDSAFASDNAGVSMTVYPSLFRLDNSAGSIKLAVSDQGNVGIGTAAPETALEVTGTASGDLLHAQKDLSSSGTLAIEGNAAFGGTIKLNGINYTFPAADGTASGKVLKTNAAGQLSWSTDNDSGTNSITAPTAEGMFVNQGGDTMTGALQIRPTTLGEAELEVAGTASGKILSFGTRLTGSGNVSIRTLTDSTTAFQVLDNDGGNPVFNIDTVNERVGIGTTSPTNSLDVSVNNSTAVTAENIQTNSVGGVYISNDLNAAGTTQGSVLMFDNVAGRSRAAISGFHAGTNLDTSALAFYTHSSSEDVQERMRVDYQGNVGIGTTTPGSKLSVSGTMSGKSLQVTGTGAAPIIFTDTKTGRVGIGTTSPGSPLTVNSSTRNVIDIQGGAASDWWHGYYLEGKAAMTAGDSSWLRLNQAGNFTAGVYMPLGTLAVDKGLVVGDASTTITPPTDGMIVKGNVGIGTTAPETKLEVTGSASGNFIFGQQGLGSSGAVVIKKRSGTATGNTLVVDTNGLVYDATNKRVGIGTTSPGAKLEINNEYTGTPNLRLKAFDGTYYMDIQGMASSIDGSSARWDFKPYDFGGLQGTAALSIEGHNGNVGIGSESPETKLEVTGTMSGKSLQVTGTGAAPLIYTDQTTGNVGIGTAAPTAKLHVTGGLMKIGTDTFDTITGVQIATAPAGGYGQLGVFDTTAAALGVGGDVRLGGLYNGNNYTTWSNVKGAKETATSGEYGGALTFGTRANGGAITEKMRITSGGNVGIGTDSPGSKLHVIDSVAGTASIQSGVDMATTVTGTNSADLVGLGYQGLYVHPVASNATQYNGIAVAPQLANAVVTASTMNGVLAYPGYGYNTGATVSNAAGLRVKSWGNRVPSTFTNQYGIYLENITGATNNYGIYSAGGKNYFAGNVGIGTIAPETALEVTGTMSGRLLQITGTGASPLILAKDGKVGIGTTNLGSAGLSVMNGNVGIGTTSPAARLHVYNGAVLFGNDTFTNWYLSANVGQTAGRSIDGNSMFVYNGNISTDRTGVLIGDSTGGYGFVQSGLQHSNGVWVDRNLVLQNEGGNVGIGTTTPNAKLSVAGTASGRILSFGDRLTGSGTVSIRTLIDSTTAFQVLDSDGGTPVFNIDTTNERVGIGTASPLSKLEVSDSALIGSLYLGDSAVNTNIGRGQHKGQIWYDGSSVLNLYSYDAGGIAFHSSGGGDTPATEMFIKSGGNVGIGTTAPETKLEVTGSTSGNFIFGQQGLGASGAVVINKRAGTATGNTLVVDTKGLVYDATNKRVGIGTAAPGETLSVVASTTTDVTPYFTVKNSNGHMLMSVLNGYDPNGTVAWNGTPGGTLVIGADYADGRNPVSTIALWGNVSLGDDLYANNTYLIRQGDATSVAAQKNSAPLLFQNSLWDTAAHQVTSNIQSIASTTESMKSRLGFFMQSEALESAIERVSILSNGNVGIGTTAPETKLEVTGTMSGNFIFGQQGMGASGAVVIKKRAGTATGNTLIVDTNGLVYDATNKRVGIGTTSPAAIFHVKGSGTADLVVVPDSTAETSIHTTGNDHLYLGAANLDQLILRYDGTGNIGIWDTTPDALLEVSANGGAGDLFMLSANDDNDGDKFIVKNSGNVGIGTTAPETKLEVAGTMSGRLLQITGTGASPLIFAKDGKVGIGTTDLGSAGLAVMNGNVGIGTTSPQGKLSVISATSPVQLIIGNSLSESPNNTAELNFEPSAGFVAAPNVSPRIYAITDGSYNTDFRFDTYKGGVGRTTNVLSLTSAGNVGIGTTAPETKLEVTGTMSGAALQANNINGSAGAATGSIMIGQAAGAPIWKAPTSAMVWYVDGAVATGTKQSATVVMPYGFTCTDIDMRVDTAPVGSSLIVDINKDGTTIFSTRPEIDASGTTEDGNHAFSVTDLPAGSVITLDVDQVGSGTAGSDFTVILKGTRKY